MKVYQEDSELKWFEDRLAAFEGERAELLDAYAFDESKLEWYDSRMRDFRAEIEELEASLGYALCVWATAWQKQAEEKEAANKASFESHYHEFMYEIIGRASAATETDSDSDVDSSFSSSSSGSSSRSGSISRSRSGSISGSRSASGSRTDRWFSTDNKDNEKGFCWQCLGIRLHQHHRYQTINQAWLDANPIIDGESVRLRRAQYWKLAKSQADLEYLVRDKPYEELKDYQKPRARTLRASVVELMATIGYELQDAYLMARQFSLVPKAKATLVRFRYEDAGACSLGRCKCASMRKKAMARASLKSVERRSTASYSFCSSVSGEYDNDGTVAGHDGNGKKGDGDCRMSVRGNYSMDLSHFIPSIFHSNDEYHRYGEETGDYYYIEPIDNSYRYNHISTYNDDNDYTDTSYSFDDIHTDRTADDITPTHTEPDDDSTDRGAERGTDSSTDDESVKTGVLYNARRRLYAFARAVKKRVVCHCE